MHTDERLFAIYSRNTGRKDGIIRDGPMGRRTDYYLRNRNVPEEATIRLASDAFEFIRTFEGEFPGTASSGECGNNKDYDRIKAKGDSAAICEILLNYPAEYPSCDVERQPNTGNRPGF